MQDIISMLRRNNKYADPLKQDGLFNAIQAGNYTIDAQASVFHYCDPRKDGMPAFMYDTLEVQITPTIPEMIKYDMRNHPIEEESNIIAYVTKRELQQIYNYLLWYSKLENQEKRIKQIDKYSNLEYNHELKAIRYAEISHNTSIFIQKTALRRTFLMALGMK